MKYYTSIKVLFNKNLENKITKRYTFTIINMNIVLFEQTEINQKLNPKDSRSEHIIKILHKNVGDTFDAGIVNGKAGKATIISIEDGIEFSFEPLSDGKPLYPLSMLIGFPRPIQLKRLFRDMAGLGIDEILLTGTELGEKSYMQSTLIEKGSAYNLLKEGSVQAKSTHIPSLTLFPKLSECLKTINQNTDENILKIALDNINPTMSLTNFMAEKYINAENKPQRIIAAIGSERGWTLGERELLKQNNFILCSMGNRVLRTETAATVAASIILSQIGVLS